MLFFLVEGRGDFAPGKNGASLEGLFWGSCAIWPLTLLSWRVTGEGKRTP